MENATLNFWFVGSLLIFCRQPHCKIIFCHAPAIQPASNVDLGHFEILVSYGRALLMLSAGKKYKALHSARP